MSVFKTTTRRRRSFSNKLSFMGLEKRRMLASLANGEIASGSFLAGGSIEYDFEVASAGTVRVSVGELGSFGAEPVMNVFDSGGNLVASDNSSSDAVVEFSTFQSGTFTAVVSDFSNDEAMSFQIRALSLPGTSQLFTGQDKVLGNGEIVDAAFDLGSFSVFPFDVDAAGTVRVSVGETGLFGAEPVLRVFDSSGNIVSSDDSASDAVVEFSTFQSGTFTAVVSDFSNDEAMSFQIRALSLPDTSQLFTGQDKVLGNGEIVDAAFDLGSFSVFPFDVDAAGTVRVSVGETVARAAEPVLRVFDSSGNLVSSDDSASDAVVEFSTFQSGTFTAVVSDFSNDEAMSFQIRALSLPGTSQLFTGQDNTLGNGEIVDAAFDLGSFSVFPFEVNAKGTVRVSVGETGSFGAEPFLEIFDNRGNLVASDNSSSDAVVEFSTFQIGTFTAVVSDFSNDEAMSFQIRALSLPGTSELFTGQDKTLRNGEVVDAAFDLGSFSVFPFELVAVGTVLVSVEETGSLGAEPVLQVFDGSGNHVDVISSSSDAAIEFSTFQTGKFIAVVSDFSNDEAMSFEITAEGPLGAGSLLGDVNQDGEVNFLDITPFIGVLSAAGTQAEADVNQDGTVNFLDITPFINVLSSQGSAAQSFSSLADLVGAGSQPNVSEGADLTSSDSSAPTSDGTVAQLSKVSSGPTRKISDGFRVQLFDEPSSSSLPTSDVVTVSAEAAASTAMTVEDSVDVAATITRKRKVSTGFLATAVEPSQTVTVSQSVAATAEAQVRAQVPVTPQRVENENRSSDKTRATTVSVAFDASAALAGANQAEASSVDDSYYDSPIDSGDSGKQNELIDASFGEFNSALEVF